MVSLAARFGQAIYSQERGAETSELNQALFPTLKQVMIKSPRALTRETTVSGFGSHVISNKITSTLMYYTV